MGTKAHESLLVFGGRVHHSYQVKGSNLMPVIYLKSCISVAILFYVTYLFFLFPLCLFYSLLFLGFRFVNSFFL